MWVFDDNIEKFLEPVEIGDKVTGECSVKSNEYKGKWYTNIYCLTMEKVERKKRQSHNYRSYTYNDPFRNRTTHFDGCTTQQEIKKRFRDLCKKYHPDTGNGDEKLMKEINEEYNRIK